MSRVRLEGPLDRVWVGTYLALWSGLTFFSGFRLEGDLVTIRFPSPRDEKELDRTAMLCILDAMVRLTNDCARTTQDSSGQEEPFRFESIEEEVELLEEYEELAEEDLAAG